MSVPSVAGVPVASTAAYREWAANPALADSVRCLWVRFPAVAPAPPQDRVLPDGCIDIIWNGRSLFVAGPDTRPVPLDQLQAEFFAGVRFQIGRAHQFLGIAAWELRDQRVPLVELWGKRRITRLVAQLEAAQSPGRATKILEDVLLGAVAQAAPPDPVVDALISQLRTRGELVIAPSPDPVAQISHSAGVSSRQLLRRCRTEVGYGPKTLDRILRFQRARRLNHGVFSLADLAAAAGYADQAHLARECRRLAGLTPSDLFKLGGRPQP